MSLRFKNNLSNKTDRVPSGLRKLDFQRARQKEEKNFSLKIEKLYSIAFSLQDPGIEGNFLTRENGFILATSDDKLIELD